MKQSSILSILRIGDQYVFQIEAEGAACGASRAIITWTLDQATRRTLQDEMAITAELLNNLLEPESPPPPDSSDAAPDPWLSLGRRLYAQLLPPSVQTFLRQLPPLSPLTLATNDTALPWELLHDGDRYLALVHPVGRQLLLDALPRQGKLHPGGRCAALLIGNPTGDLDEGDAEVQTLIEHLEMLPDAKRPRALLRQRATKEAVLRELAGGEYTLIHYAGHAQAAAGQEEGGALVLARGERLTAGEIAQHLSGQPLVFLNACASAQEPVEPAGATPGLAHLRDIQGLATGFVRGGARGVVGTLWPVHDAGSRQLAEAFYQHALQGIPVGEALRQARLQVRGMRPPDPIWAAFLLYGDPQDQLLTSDRWTRQHATLLCARLADLDPILPTLRAEAVAEFLDTRVELVTTEIERYGGVVHSVTQEAVLGAFGLVPGLAHDAERAVRAALAIQKGQQRQSGFEDQQPVPRRPELVEGAIGIHTGEVLIRHPTAEVRGKLTVAGDTVERVRWLARRAEPGQVLISTEAAQPVRSQFVVAPHPGEVGPDQPMAVFRVLGPGGTPGYRTPFLGREDELATLLRCWERALQGRGRLVGVVGEAGIGKTRLLHAFHDRLGDEDLLWIEARCPSARPDVPFGALAPLIRAWFHIPPDAEVASIASAEPFDKLRTGLSAGLRDVLGVEAGQLTIEQIEPQVRHGLLVRAFRELLAQSARQRPVAVILDDMQCVDPSSLEIIDRLVDSIERLPVLFILAYRPEWTHGWINRPNYHHVTLARLDDETSAALLHTLLGAEAAASRLGRDILARSKGIPFFLEELVRSLQVGGAIMPADGGWRVTGSVETTELPSTIQRSVAGRIERLGPETRGLLQLAAVVGDPFTVPMLSNVWITSEAGAALDENLRELVRRDFVFERWAEGEFQFYHPLIQEVAYAGLSASQHCRLHRRVAGSLERTWPEPTGEQIEMLAHHFYQSVAQRLEGPLDGLTSGEVLPEEVERATDYLIQAGAGAHRRYANHEAVTAYRRAWGLLERLPSARRAHQLECLEGLGEAFSALGNFDGALENLERAFALLRSEPMSTGDRRRAADLARRIGRLYVWKGEYETALSWMRDGLAQLGELCDEDDRATASLLHIHTGTVYYNQGNHKAAAEECRAGLELAETTHRPPVQAEGYNLLGVICDTRGQSDEALAHYARSLDTWQRLGDAHQVARVEDNIGTVYFYRGEWDAARAHYARSLAFWEKIEDQDNLAYACNNLGSIDLHQGDWEQARESFERALVLWEKVQNPRWIAQSHNNLGLLYIEQGDWNRAQEHLERSREILFRLDVQDLLSETYRGLAEVALGLKQPAQAVELAQKAADLAAGQEMRFEQAVALRTLGRACAVGGDLIQGREHLKTSLTILEDLPNRYEMARTQYHLYFVEAGLGNDEDAQWYLQQAIATFEEVGAKRNLERAQREGSAWGEKR